MAKEKDTKPAGGFRDHQCGTADEKPEAKQPEKSEAKAEAGDK
jgi:hypothetical protein